MVHGVATEITIIRLLISHTKYRPRDSGLDFYNHSEI